MQHEVKFKASFLVGDTVYDVTNGMRGVVVSHDVTPREVLYKVAWASGYTFNCYPEQLSEDKTIF